MTDEWVFEKVGAYWELPLFKKLWVSLVCWFRGTWMFLRGLSHYQESIVCDETTIRGKWFFCHSIKEAQVGKTLRRMQTLKEASG